MLKFGSKSDVTVLYRATIRLLDDSEIIHCDFQPQHKGSYILEYVCKQLNILEIDYFGLRYVDSSRQRHWLDLSKTAIKQVKDMDTILFSFRVKYYPPDPLRLKEEITRYQIYLQLKRDLLHGRLYCSPGEAALLAACIIQSELGDYDPEVHEGNYIADHKLLLKQTPAIEERALELHQTQLKGFSPEQAELQFLKLAAQLDTYAVDPHPVKDHKGTTLYLGINHCGILTFQGSRKTNHFRWPEVQKINYEGKMFIVHLTITEDMRTKKKHTVGFKCPTGSNCRHVWRCAIEQMVFFTLTRASDAPVMSGGSIFSWGTKFKYTGRTEREVLEESGPLRKEEPPIQRCSSTSLRRKASSVPATPSTPSQDLVEIRYSSLPRSCHSAGLDGAGMSDIGSGMPLSSPYCPDNTLPLLETVSEDQEIHARRNNALDETNTHASANTTTTTTTTTSTTTTTCYTTTGTSTITTTITTTTTMPTTPTTTTTMSTNSTAISNSSTTTTIDNTKVPNTQQVAKMLKKYHPKSTPQTRPQALYSQRIVIGSEELSGQDIDNVVRQKIDALEKSPKVVRSTALIVKRSVAPAKTRPAASSSSSATGIIASPQQHQQQITTTTTTSTVPSVPNGDLRPNCEDVVDAAAAAAASAVSHDFDSGSDYYFRDSFEHSASESHLLEASGLSGKAGAYGSSRSIAPLPKLQRLQNSKICNVQQTLTSPSSAITSPAPSSRHQHRQSLQQQAASAAAAAVTGSGEPVLSAPCSSAQQRLRGCQAQLVRLIVPALMLSLTVLLVVAVLVFETDSKLLDGLRKSPHMLALRDQYYGPIKNFLRSKLGLF